MKNTRILFRVLSVVAVTLVMAFGFVACGDDDDGLPSSSSAVSESSASSASGGASSGNSASGGASSVSSGGASSASSGGGGGSVSTFTETFNNLTLGGSYVNGSFTGVGGIVWNYTQARGDQSLNGKAITFKDSTGKLSATIPGGIGSLTFSLKQPFSKPPVCAIYVGGVQKGLSSYTVGGGQNAVETFTIGGINQPGPVTLEFRMSGNQATIDDITITPGTPTETDRPEVTITSPTAGATLTSWNFTIEGTASDPGVGASGVKEVWVKINSGAWVKADGVEDWDYDLTLSASGPVTISAYAKDNAENYSLTNTISVTAPADTTKPVVTVASPTESQAITNYNLTLSGSTSDAGFSAGLDGVWISLDSGTAVRASGAASWSHTFTSITEGAHTLTVYAKDLAGNQSETVTRNVTITWPPDNTKPTCAITSPADGSQQNVAGFTIAGTANDPGSDASGVKEVWVRLNGGAWAKASGTTSWTYTTGSLAEGSLNIEAKAVDNANPTGNESVVVSRTVTIVAVPTFVENTSLPANVRSYYSAAYGKTGSELWDALNSIVKAGHSAKGYAAVWTFYNNYEKTSDGMIWDMYSSTSEDGASAAYWFTPVSDQCGNYNGENVCYNREHSWPKSGFGGAESSTPGNDVHHIPPTDGYVNSKRSNYPYGEVGSATWTSQNGSKLGSARSGLGYSGTVFEPIDIYKGDFARMHFYMALRYENDSLFTAVGWADSGAKLKPWYKTMLRAWHANDPVHAKEITRNNGAHTHQGNRNPFIDYPELVEMLFGD